LWNGEDGPAHIVDVITGEKKATLGTLDQGIWVGAFSADGALLALTDQHRIDVWRPRTGERVLAIPATDDLFITDLAFAPDGRRLIASGGQATPIARIWDMEQGRPLIDLRGHTHSLTTATFSPDARLAATASQDGTARVWRVADGQPLTVYRGHQGMVLDVQFSADGRLVLSSAADGTSRIFEASVATSLLDLVTLAHQRRTRELTPKEREQFIH
jgi:WD40 repeat protein